MSLSQTLPVGHIGTTMKAAAISAPRQVSLTDLPLPEPGLGEVRIQLEGCGVCGSNLPMWEGREWFTYPSEPGAPGHEGWGTVHAVGPGTTGLAVGERVAVLSNHAFAEYDVTSAESVVKLPDGLRDVPFPGEPLACAVNVFKRSDVQPGQTVAIVGIGFLGALLTRLCVDAGAQVIAITRREYALDVARQFGASEAIKMDDHWRVIEQVKALTGGEGCARVIEAVGQQWPLDIATDLTGVRGKMIIAGYHQDGLRQVNVQKWNWQGLDVINAHERDPQVYVQGMREAVDLVASGRLDPTPLYATFSLDDLGAAMEAMRTRPDGFLKALVMTR